MIDEKERKQWKRVGFAGHTNGRLAFTYYKINSLALFRRRPKMRSCRQPGFDLGISAMRSLPTSCGKPQKIWDELQGINPSAEFPHGYQIRPRAFATMVAFGILAVGFFVACSVAYTLLPDLLVC